MMRTTRLTLITLLLSGLPIPSSAQENDRAAGSALSLEEAVRHYYAHDPALQASYAALRAVQERYPQAQAGWRPSADIEAGLYSSDIENSNFGAADGTTTKELAFNLEQPLYRGGQTSAELRAANATIMAARADTVRAQQQGFYRVAQAYITAARDRTMLDLRYRDEERLQQELTAVNERFEGGEITLTDVRQTQAELARAQANTIDARSRLDASAAQFERETGLPLPRTLYYPSLSLPFSSSLEEMISLGDAQNPGLAAARFMQEAAGHDADKVLRELYPQLFAYANINKQWDPQPGILDDSRISTIGLRATIALYEGGATRSRARQAKHTERQRAYEITDRENETRAQIISAWKQWQAAKQSIVQREQEIDAMEKVLEGIHEEARAGTRTVLDILDAGEDLIQSRLSLTLTRHTYYLTSFQLALHTGLLTPDLFQAQEGSFDAEEHLHHIQHQFFTTDID